jgi:hypothetical protein
VDPDDPAVLAAAIDRLLCDASCAAKLAERGVVALALSREPDCGVDPRRLRTGDRTAPASG